MSSERTLRIALFAVAAAAVVAVAACGNKRPPAPPPQIIPARTLDLRIQQRGDELLLSFTYPTTTMGGGVLGDLSGVEFWEVVRETPLPGTAPPAVEDDETEAAADDVVVDDTDADDTDADDEAVTMALDDPATSEESGPPTLTPIDPLEFAAAATVRATLSGAELNSAIQGEKIFARFPLGQSPAVGQLEAHHFAIKTLSGTGLGSPFSNIVNLARRDTPEPPSEFEVEPGSAGIELSWFFAGEGPPEESSDDESDEDDETPAPQVEVEEITAPEIEFEAFNIYRRGARERNYGSPLVRLDSSRREYVDRSASFGEAYIYAVAAVLENDPVVETALSAEREIDFTDRFAPPPPRNLVTLAERDSVRILWDASVADDVDGYVLLRAAADGEFTPLNDELIRELEYTDRAVTSGVVYRYRLIAVDQEGNRSAESAISEARVP